MSDANQRPERDNRIDEICAQFASAYRAGHRPTVEEFLRGIGTEPAEAPPGLVRELCKLEAMYRAGVSPSDWSAAVTAAGLSSADTNTFVPDGPTQRDAVAGPDPASGSFPRVPGYEIREEIARGGMGIVYRAHEPRFGREVAIKVLHDRYRNDPVATARFVVEARLTGRLQHPGIPPVFEVGTLPDESPFLAMKLIEGRTLAQMLAAERPAPEALVATFEHVCQALAFAHSRGIIHRDLKPANVMVGAFGEVQVMDWGLAKELADRNRGAGEPVAPPAAVTGGGTEAGAVLGTPAYMAPEQARGETERIDRRADVFGLGALLCEVLTGRPPFVGGPFRSALGMAVDGAVDEAFGRLAVCGAGPDLVALCQQCLAPEPANRPADAGVVARSVAHLRAAAEERARQAEQDRVVAESQRARAEREVREQRKLRRVQLALAGAVGLLLLGGGAVAWWQEHRAAEQQLADERAEGERRALAARLEAEQRFKVEQARQGIDTSLALAAALRKQYRFQEAGAALAQAVELGKGAPERLPEVEQAQRDLAFVVQLDGIRFRKWVWTAAPGGSGEFNTKIAAPEYRKAFRAGGLDLVALDPEAAVRLFAASAVKSDLVAAVDDWALYEPDAGLRARLLELARRVDPGPWTDRLRDPTVRTSQDALKKLAVDADPSQTSPAALVALAELMRCQGLNPAVLLTSARSSHPTDFELAFALGRWWLFSNDRQRIGPYEAARALRPDNQAAWGNLGIALFEEGNPDAAVRAFRRVIAIDRNDATAHYNLAVALSASGDQDGARGACEVALGLDPNYAVAHARLGCVFLAKKDLDAAIAAFQKANALDPKIAFAHTNLGVALAAKGDHDGAIKAYREALRLDPKDALTQFNLAVSVAAKGPKGGSIDEYKRAIALNPKDPKAYINLGAALAANGEHDEAIKAYRDALRIDPMSALTHTNLGVALAAKGDYDGAVAAHKSAIAFEPGLALAHYNLGFALYAKKDREGAIVAYRECIRLDPNNAKAHSNLGVALRNSNDLTGAIAAYREAVRLDPRDAKAVYNLGLALALKGDHDGAIAAFRDVIRIEPTHSRAHTNLGNALHARGDHDGAIAAFQGTIKLDPKDALAHTNLGVAFAAKGNYERAIEVHKRAIVLDPKLVLAHTNLGVALQAIKDHDGAAVAYREALRLDPNYARAHTCSGSLYLDQKRYQEAASAARTAIKINPAVPNAHALLGFALRELGDPTGARAALTEAARLNPQGFGHLLRQLPPIPVAPPPRVAGQQ